MANQKFSTQSNNYTLGIILVVVGGIILLKKLGFFLPLWLLSWPMVFIAIGLVILVSQQFKSGSGYFFLLFGSYFMLKKHVDLPDGFEGYFLAGGLIAVGLYFILNQKSIKIPDYNQSMKNEPFGYNAQEAEVIGDENSTTSESSTNSGFDQPEILTSQAFLSGDQRRILSKNFKGGKISAILGGSEIDLSQADMTEPAMLNIEVALGGVKLIVPPHWSVQVNVSNVLAGVEDKRLYAHVTPDPKKILKIYGSVILGGLEIKSF
ncbi:LiaF transmembrane domain-containing protein [Belliella aquatica]|uniref:LiaF transmembrane domain-containing protein n=1 Tax=Belliella aquatica TaxID=1323734 RepID=A0ABQ1M745_9BACT|nr:DUF5668 domain-containing protein [Belliella aquatica]MCH7404836.1 cell wall-active antibiotics response protein [Belliella aquatica]GGC33822.1 hypothetical protein GCM10010993_10810 [Belliella aquatica]